LGAVKEYHILHQNLVKARKHLDYAIESCKTLNVGDMKHHLNKVKELIDE
jgi:hypothetical protein